ncbi:MAG: 3-oxoacyl-[acyl-carrier-protein] reductase [Candidatus Mcinerneyibacterium aminivorans]|uniref:3-oxoacyl-[acyl-carrier-protein] reductase n=1 Tax=Candidatus Mcinerneyibacterium aminivorans TaxID=2703815 RepID=A0A5D0ML41_9BACT|nr:MAG: 3-oxoacyl-[acyl-carrier-protein] reductase [Candidatus Mcinerneyibacterium aminivorans]
MNLEGKTALITGAARGIGKEIAIKFAETGCNIAICDLDKEKIESTIDEIRETGVEAYGEVCDVTSMDSVKDMVKKFLEKFDKIDILVNNAGITQDTLLMRMSEKQWKNVIDVNLNGTFNVTRSLIRSMMKNKYGKIINISSVVGLMGNAGQANYSATKAGVIGFTKTVAKEYGKRNIYANAVAPGFIETDMTEKLSEKAEKDLMNNVSIKRKGKPEDVANLVLFLASDLSDYITGEVISVDGGMRM